MNNVVLVNGTIGHPRKARDAVGCFHEQQRFVCSKICPVATIKKGQEVRTVACAGNINEIPDSTPKVNIHTKDGTRANQASDRQGR